MSNVNIKRLVENIKANTTVYSPIVEVIVNGIQAIEDKKDVSGKIVVSVHRSKQGELYDGLAEVQSFEIKDNGIGFTEDNRNSFDTLYSDLKISSGGKGFGRFTCLKYFENLNVQSVYKDKNSFKQRNFSMGKDNEIIVNEKVRDSEEEESGSTIHLNHLKKGKAIDKKITTIARNLVERLLPYFITKDYVCPEIMLREKDGTSSILLNDFFTNKLSDVIKETHVENSLFLLGGKEEEEFTVRVFKLYYPKSNQKSRISLVAHRREVSGSPIHKYIPEFIEDFYEKNSNGNINHEKNYMVKAYVFSSFLDRNVSLERDAFEFQMEQDCLIGISQDDIEARAANIAKDAVGDDVVLRQEKKREGVQSYVDQTAPWHKGLLDKIDLTGMPYNASDEQIEALLQHEKFAQEAQIKKEVSQLLAESNLEKLKDNAPEIVSKISETSKNDLIHYIALRKNILDIFGKSLEVDETGIYRSEGVVHDIIFPRRGQTDITSFEDHNLWIIDERLNFTNFVASDIPLDGRNSGRPDLIVYNKRVLFRGDNEASYPIIIFEFKKPQRDDFTNSSSEDPVQQIVRYVIKIRDGKYKTPQGRKMLVAPNTPFYGYVVCDLTPKVETWLEFEKNFTPMPDRLGWFQWRDNIKLYIEVISWDKVLKDANMRNKVFFHKLGI